MAPKRPLDDDAAESHPKKARTGFKVGPDNLPDGTWRRKVVKIKKDLIHKAKIKKSYAKIKAHAPEEPARIIPATSPPPPAPPADAAPEPSQEIHPSRQAMLDAPHEPSPPPGGPDDGPRRPRERRPKRPRYFEKEQAFAEKQRAEAEARRAEIERRDRERKMKIEERERFRKAMAKARTGGRNGQRKLGKESKVLLERVKRIVAE